MKRIVIKPLNAGHWLYAIYIDGRAVLVGTAPSLEGAEAEARLA